jgi:hypothetical protein
LEAPFTVDPIPVSMFTLYSNPANNSNESGILHDEDDEPVVDNALTLSSSDSITLTGGVYYFTSINSNGLINVIGSSTIYVDGGDIKLAGQGIVNNAQPRNLLIYSSGGMINISGGSSLSGAIYAPNATVKLSGHDNVFGSITCGVNVDVGQAAVHFDMDLLDEAPVFASSRVTSWQDIA